MHDNLFLIDDEGKISISQEYRDELKTKYEDRYSQNCCDVFIDDFNDFFKNQFFDDQGLKLACQITHYCI